MSGEQPLGPTGDPFLTPRAAPMAAGPEEGIDVAKYLAAIRRRWPLILVCCLLAGAYALVRYVLTAKEYRATAMIQIERKRLSVVASGGQASWLEDWWNLEYYPTQYRLLRSRGMAERVVRNLRLHEDPAFVGRQVQQQMAKDASNTAYDEALMARLGSRLRSGLTVNPIKDTQLVELSYRSSSSELAAQVANGYAEAFIQWGIEARSSTVGRASTYLSEQIETLRREIEEQRRQLESIGPEGELDPAGEALLERRTRLEEERNRVAADRISKQAIYQELLNLGDDAVAARQPNDRLGQLTAEIFRLESEYNTKLSTYRPEWPAMVELQSKVSEKRSELQRLRREAARDARRQAEADYKKALAEEEALEAELRKLKGESTALNSTALEYNNRLMQIKTREELLNELLKRQSETAVATGFQGSKESNVRIVDRAVVPGAAFRPVLRNDVSAALLFGLALGFAGIFLLEYLDRTIKTAEELESITGLPNLAVIPDISEAPTGYGARLRSAAGYGYGYGYSYGYGEAENQPALDARRHQGPLRFEAGKGGGKVGKVGGAAPAGPIELLPHYKPRLAVCEAYRALRTALLLSSAKRLEVVALTSAQPGEGKTATTTNLAVVLAQLGRSVLIIDGDLRRPRMHKVFNISNKTGLVSYLTGTAQSNEIFLDTEVPDLFVCPSGPIPPNPSELLASDRMREYLEAARACFDFVLIDTPPALPVADAAILGTIADGVIICARAGTLLREDAKDCRERLRYNDLKLLGMVLNRYRSGPGRYYKRYHYHAGYGDEGEQVTAHNAA